MSQAVWRRACAAALFWLLGLTGVRAEPVPVQLELLDAGASAETGLTPIAPGALLQRNPQGAWVRITPQRGWPQGEPLVLSVDRFIYGELRLQRAAPAAPDAETLRGFAGDGLQSFSLPRDLAADAPLWLYVAPHPAATRMPTVSVEPQDAFAARLVRGIAVISGCLAAMVALCLTALVFALLLRDAVFLPYAAYLACFVVIQLMETGLGFIVPGWDRDHPLMPLVGRFATIGGVVTACLFMMSFTELRQRSRPLWRTVQGYLVIVVLVLGLGLLPVRSAAEFAHHLVNPLLAVGALLAPLAAAWAWWRGTRYGAYFLLGWLPLMAATFVGSVGLDGAALPWDWRGQPLVLAGTFEALILSLGLADRTLAHRRSFQEAQALTYTDALTGLLNRRGWLHGTQAMIDASRSGRTPVQLLFIDLDHFKSLNDSFGHGAGDDALRRFADLLRELCPPRSLVGRYGGEEFVVTMPISAKLAAETAEDLREALCELGIAVDPSERRLSLSGGLAGLMIGESLEALIERADQAMYQAKSRGRNRIVVASRPAVRNPVRSVATAG